MRKNRWESKLDPGSLYQVIYFLSSICSRFHSHPRLSGTSLFPLIIFSGSQGLFLLFLQSVIMKSTASWGEGILLITMYKVKRMADFICSGTHLLPNCALEEDRSITIWRGWGSFVNKVSHSNKFIVSWKCRDPFQSVLIRQVQHY